MDGAEPEAATTATAPQAVDADVVTSRASTPSSKRPRDYAAELRGLTPGSETGDEGARRPVEDSSSPMAKRKRVDRPEPTSDVEEAGQSEVEDGEISEASCTSRRGSDASVESSKLRSPKAGSPTAPALGYNPGISLGVRTSFGKGPSFGGAMSKPTASTPLFGETTSRSPSPAGSVKGGSPGQESGEMEESEPSSSAPGSSAPASAPGSAPASAPASTKGKPPSSLTFNADDITWTVPAIAPFPMLRNAALRKPNAWRAILDQWITTFLKANISHASDVTKKILQRSLDSYINIQFVGVKRGKDSVVKAKSAATKMWLGVDQKTLDKLVSISRQDAERELAEEEGSGSDSDSQAMSESDNEKSEEVNEDGEVSEADPDETLRLQNLYFPNATDPSQICLSCSNSGHKTSSCPQRICRFCSSSKHTSYGCPTTKRCSKCQQLGHSSKACTEKLALSSTEDRVPCAFCGAPHLETECSEIWRSYNPGAVSRKTVQSIPAYCYNCGREGHYGPECGLPSRKRNIAGPTTWSSANRDLYIDPESIDIAIGWVDYQESHHKTTNGVDGFQIRGAAAQAKRTHTHFVSSDDSDDGFIHEPVRSRIPNQQGGNKGGIRIASNIGTGNPPPPPPPLSAASRNSDSGGRRGGRNGGGRHNERELSPPPPPPKSGGWQPPLPPGPPPPPSGFANLPPRPGRNNGGGGGGAGGKSFPTRPNRGRGGGGGGRGRGGSGGGGGGRGRGGRR